jgi:dTDP-4-dehydrorhamnose reductase
VAILGVNGMLGHKLFQHLRDRYPSTTGLMRGDADRGPLKNVSLLHGPDVWTKVDVMDFGSVRRRLEGLRPDIVVNAIGIVKQKDEAKELLPSIAVNAYFPHLIASILADWGGRLIHVSTDCVFSGQRGDYRESDLTDAEDLYGRTKALGEASEPNALTLRTSIIGRELSGSRSLLEWFLSQRGRTVRGFSRAWWSGVSTIQLARLILGLIHDGSPLTGIYQVSSGKISKYELLLILRDAFGVPMEIVRDEEFFCDRSLDGGKFEKATGWRAPPWREMAAELAADPTPYGRWRGECP